jgi:hypothetical protein
MNKIFLISFIGIFLFACDIRPNKEKETQQDISEVVSIKTLYCDSDTSVLYESHRCDKIAFKALEVAFCERGSIAGHYDGGKIYRWNLDTDEPCYENGEDLGSQSECSGDGYICASHTWLTFNDQPQASQTLQYIEDENWICGEGYTGYTKMGKLKWLLRTVRDHLEGKQKPTPIEVAAAMKASNLTNIADLLREFNKYLVALHAYAFGRMNHAFSDETMKILRDLVDSSPDSMIFQALYHRFLDGDQQIAIDLIKRECPTDKLPTDINYLGWGSSPRAIHCIVAISILQGK